MNWTIVEVATTLFECFVSTEFVTRYLGFKNKEIKYYLGFTLSVLLQVASTLEMNSYTLFEGIGGLIYPAILVGYGMLCLNGSIFEKIIIACIENGLNMLTSVTVLTIINYLTPLDINQLITEQGVVRILIIFMAKGSYFFLTRIILRMNKRNKFALSSIEWIAIFGVFIMSFISGVFVFQMVIINPSNKYNDFLSVSAIVCLILINVFCYYIFIKMSAKNKEKMQYSFIEFKLLEQQKSLSEMKLLYDEFMKLRHDMKNYLGCVGTMLHNEKYIEAKNYLDSLFENKLSFGKQYILTENDAVNAIMNSKMSICEEQGIKMDYQISGSLNLFSELDLSVLLGNLLDNAIEACMKVENTPKIDIKIYNERNYLVINVANSIKESVLEHNPNLHSTKKDTSKHGFGTVSIKDIVKNHNGMIRFYEKNNHFITDIWLKLDKKD